MHHSKVHQFCTCYVRQRFIYIIIFHSICYISSDRRKPDALGLVITVPSETGRTPQSVQKYAVKTLKLLVQFSCVGVFLSFPSWIADSSDPFPGSVVATLTSSSCDSFSGCVRDNGRLTFHCGFIYLKLQGIKILNALSWTKPPNSAPACNSDPWLFEKTCPLKHRDEQISSENYYCANTQQKPEHYLLKLPVNAERYEEE